MKGVVTASASRDARWRNRNRGVLAASALGAAAIALTASEAVGAADAATVDLSPIVAAWPTSYTVTASKSEPTYVEHITVTRDGSSLALEIQMAAQGTGSGGTSLARIEVQDDGTIAWTEGCTSADCEDATDLRGFLSTAQLIAAQRQGRLPATGTLRQLGDHEVVCVDDADLHPDDPATLDLQPCFSVATGAVLGHWSTAADDFVGATMSATTITETTSPSSRLFADASAT